MELLILFLFTTLSSSIYCMAPSPELAEQDEYLSDLQARKILLKVIELTK